MVSKTHTYRQMEAAYLVKAIDNLNLALIHIDNLDKITRGYSTDTKALEDMLRRYAKKAQQLGLDIKYIPRR